MRQLWNFLRVEFVLIYAACVIRVSPAYELTVLLNGEDITENVTDSDLRLERLDQCIVSSDYHSVQSNRRHERAVANLGGHTMGHDFSRQGKECLVRHTHLSNKKPRIALMVNSGDRVSMICNYCEDPASEKFESMIWYRIHRLKHASRGYRVSEVAIDMHDDESRNRVVVGNDHRLVFNATTTGDSGSYFCRSSSEGKGLNYIHHAKLTDIMTSSKSFKALYNLDVLPEKMNKFRKVTATGIVHPKPAATEVIALLNLAIYTQWEDWGDCNVCGRVGKRYRKGFCMVKKNYPSIPSRAWHLEEMLNFYPDGVPCTSTLFTHVDNIKLREDEIEEEMCDVTCDENGNPMSNNKINPFTKLRILMKGGDKKSKVLKNKMATDSGENVRLFCPGAKMGAVVDWTNGTHPISAGDIKKQSAGRIEVDDVGSLRIHGAQAFDSSTYTCRYGGEKTGEVKLSVAAIIERIPEEEIWYYSTYLFLSYGFNFVVFLGIMIIRHKRRSVQRVLRPARCTSSRNIRQRESSCYMHDTEGRQHIDGTHEELISYDSDIQNSKEILNDGGH